MKLTNNEIYTYTTNLMEAFNDKAQRLPIKISFAIQKNKKTLLALAQDIEQARMDIFNQYGELNEETQNFSVKPENLATVNKELNDLFTIEQDVDILTFSIDNIDEDITLTNAQMEAIMFMIQ